MILLSLRDALKAMVKIIAGSNVSELLIFVFVTLGNRLRNDKTSNIKIAVG